MTLRERIETLRDQYAKMQGRQPLASEAFVVLGLVVKEMAEALEQCHDSEPGWMLFTATQTYRFIGKQEPPRIEGETGRVRWSATAQSNHNDVVRAATLED
jgi:hypothetical protein